MANAFNKEERVAFEDILEGFNDALVLSNSVSIYNTDQTMMERTSNTIQRRCLISLALTAAQICHQTLAITRSFQSRRQLASQSLSQ